MEKASQREGGGE